MSCCSEEGRGVRFGELLNDLFPIALYGRFGTHGEEGNRTKDESGLPCEPPCSLDKRMKTHGVCAIISARGR